MFSKQNNTSVVFLALLLLCQAVVGDDGVLGFLGVGVVRPPVVSVVVGEVSIVVPARATVEPTTGVVPAQNNERNYYLSDSMSS